MRLRYADPERIREAVHRYARGARAAHAGIRSIRWFGSWVRGDATVTSDVDLCIVVEQSDKPRRERLPDHPGMAAAIEAGIEV